MHTSAYADHPDTVLDVHVPRAGAGVSGSTVVLVHGGFWRERYRRDLMVPLVPSLRGGGHVVVKREWRRVGGAGGWPTTLLDVAAGLDALVQEPAVDPARVVVVGHSAGGHLALWATARHRLPAGAPGAGPRVRPCAVVALVITSFFMSVMYPTIFSLGIKGLGSSTELASSLLVMSVVGAAVIPPLLGLVTKATHSYALGYAPVLACYAVVAVFGWYNRTTPE